MLFIGNSMMIRLSFTRICAITVCPSGDNIAEALKQSTVDPVIYKFDVIGRNPETQAQLIDVSKLFLGDNKLCGFTSSDRSILGIGTLAQDCTFMDTIKPILSTWRQ